ncbi:MAG: HD domain-containing protein [Nitrospirae bacterium]|nr:HD domain-containing protein [Nitrospirota bacterium]
MNGATASIHPRTPFPAFGAPTVAIHGPQGMASRPGADSGGHVLIVDPGNGSSSERLVYLLAEAGYVVRSARSVEQAVDRLWSHPTDLVILGAHLPGSGGTGFLEHLRAEALTRLLPVLLLTDDALAPARLKDLDDGMTHLMSTVMDPEKLLNRVQALVHLKSITAESPESESLVVTLARTVDARDPYTAGHSFRVSYYAGLLAEAIGMDETDLIAVRRGGFFHDLGKIAVPDRVLLKTDRLTPEEFDTIKTHPRVGRDLIRHLKSLAFTLDVVYHHHERYDGSGYPAGISGEAIPLVARVTTIADIYDALTSDRPYRRALSHDEALEELDLEASIGWLDGRLVEEFRAALGAAPAVRK